MIYERRTLLYIFLKVCWPFRFRRAPWRRRLPRPRPLSPGHTQPGPQLPAGYCPRPVLEGQILVLKLLKKCRFLPVILLYSRRRILIQERRLSIWIFIYIKVVKQHGCMEGNKENLPIKKGPLYLLVNF